MRSGAVITAGGSGSRLKSSTPKQFLSLCGVPVLIHTLRAFEAAKSIDCVVVVLPKEALCDYDVSRLKAYGIEKVTHVVSGGITRQASVGNGLDAFDEEISIVAIHDGARCLVTPQLINETIAHCQGWDGAIAALPVRDTLKHVNGNTILHTQPRKHLWAMQTPQVFRYPFIRDAYHKAKQDNFEATDDASIAEYVGGKVRVVEGSTQNLKITLEEDLNIAQILLTQRGPLWR